MSHPKYDPTTSPPMTAIVRSAVIVVTAACFGGAAMSAALEQRDVAVVLALGALLGMSAWGFVRAGHNEAALALLCCVLVAVVTLTLALSRLGVHDMAVMAYGGVVLFGAMFLTQRSFLTITGLTFIAATAAFVYDLNGHSRSVISLHSGWPQYVQFVLVVAVFAYLGRMVAGKFFGSLGEMHAASSADALTGLQNRSGFLTAAAMRLRAAQARGEAVLVVADLDGFRRTNLVIGYEAADNVLKEGARRLAGECAGDLIARIGDDEFAVLRVGIHEAHAAEFARVVHAAIEFEHLGVSVRNAAGYARFPRDADGIESLMLAAESGVAHAKELEGNRIAGPADRI